MISLCRVALSSVEINQHRGAGPAGSYVHHHTGGDKLILHTGDEHTSTILEVISSSSILVKCIHICSNVLEPSSPNVLPEGLEQTIRMIDVLVPITLVTRQRWSTLL